MQVTVLEHNVGAGTAKIKFEHSGVTHTASYDLGLVIPGMRIELAQQGLEFTENMQQDIMDRLAAQVEREIDAGILVNQI